MDSSHKLLLSLKQDLKVLNKTSEEIIPNVTNFKLNSWLYPGKSYEVVSEDHISKSKQYLGYLELMIDRLYLIIHLVVNYTENLTKNSRAPKNVTRPNNLSLGASANLLWKQLQDLNDLFTVEQKKKKNFEVYEQSTQTNTYSASICNSCGTAISCMKEILHELEINTSAIFVTKIRRDLQDELYNLTQNGCMNRLTEAILQDVTVCLEHLHAKEKLNRELKTKVKTLTMKYGESLKIIHNLEKFATKMRKRSRNVKIKNKELLKRFNELVRVNEANNEKLSQQGKKIEALEKDVEERIRNVQLLSTNNKKLLDDIANTSKEKIKASKERDLWKKRFSDVYLENRELKKNNTEKVEKIGLNCEKLCSTLEENNRILSNRTEKYERLMKSYKDNKITKRNGVKKVDDKSTFKITGDPIADMRMQVEVNTCNIKMLERDNTALLTTIYRVKARTLD